MYAWLWRRLPGPRPVRVLVALVLAAAAVALLFAVVFPWAERTLPFLDVTDVTVGGGRGWGRPRP